MTAINLYACPFCGGPLIRYLYEDLREHCEIDPETGHVGPKEEDDCHDWSHSLECQQCLTEFPQEQWQLLDARGKPTLALRWNFVELPIVNSDMGERVRDALETEDPINTTLTPLLRSPEGRLLWQTNYHGLVLTLLPDYTWGLP